MIGPDPQSLDDRTAGRPAWKKKEKEDQPGVTKGWSNERKEDCEARTGGYLGPHIGVMPVGTGGT